MDTGLPCQKDEKTKIFLLHVFMTTFKDMIVQLITIMQQMGTNYDSLLVSEGLYYNKEQQ